MSTIGLQKRLSPEVREVVVGTGSALVAIAELVSSGAGVLAVCADASRRASLASGAGGLARFNGGAARIACHRCSGEALAGLSARAGAGLALTDYAALEARPDLAEEFEHVVLVDPPHCAESSLLVSRCAGRGYRHELWSDAEAEFTAAVLDRRLASRDTVAGAFRKLRDLGEASGDPLRGALAGGGAHPLCPAAAARCFRVLAEVGLVRGEPNRGDGVVGVVSSDGTDLERSAAFRAYRARHSEALRFLERPKLP